MPFCNDHRVKIDKVAGNFLGQLDLPIQIGFGGRSFRFRIIQFEGLVPDVIHRSDWFRHSGFNRMACVFPGLHAAIETGNNYSGYLRDLGRDKSQQIRIFTGQHDLVDGVQDRGKRGFAPANCP